VAAALHSILAWGLPRRDTANVPAPAKARRPASDLPLGGQMPAKMSWARLAAVPRARTAFSWRQAISRTCGSVWLAAES
jgi:hypothetical protein